MIKIVLTALAAVLTAAAQTPDSTDLSKTGFDITTVPESAQIYIDGKLSGTSPASIRGIAPGNHEILVKLHGYSDSRRTVTAIKDSAASVTDTLQKPATLTVISSPDSALLFLNRKKIEKTPFTVTGLKPGNYAVMLLKAGYVQSDTTVELSSGESDTLRAVMVLNSKSVPALSEPVKAVESVKPSNSVTAKSEPETEVPAERSASSKKRFTITAASVFAVFLTALLTAEFGSTKDQR